MGISRRCESELVIVHRPSTDRHMRSHPKLSRKYLIGHGGAHLSRLMKQSADVLRDVPSVITTPTTSRTSCPRRARSSRARCVLPAPAGSARRAPAPVKPSSQRRTAAVSPQDLGIPCALQRHPSLPRAGSRRDTLLCFAPRTRNAPHPSPWRTKRTTTFQARST